jgi:hypothetical protein
VAAFFTLWPSPTLVFPARTFDDGEVAGLEGGDLHRVLELGPTDLQCARNEGQDVSGASPDSRLPLGRGTLTSWDRE